MFLKNLKYVKHKRNIVRNDSVYDIEYYLLILIF